MPFQHIHKYLLPPAAFLVGLAGIASPAEARANGPDTTSVEISLRGLDLSSPDDCLELDRRIDRAARKVCDVRDAWQVYAERSCMRAALSNAREQRSLHVARALQRSAGTFGWPVPQPPSTSAMAGPVRPF